MRTVNLVLFVKNPHHSALRWAEVLCALYNGGRFSRKAQVRIVGACIQMWPLCIDNVEPMEVALDRLVALQTSILDYEIAYTEQAPEAFA